VSCAFFVRRFENVRLLLRTGTLQCSTVVDHERVFYPVGMPAHLFPIWMLRWNGEIQHRSVIGTGSGRIGNAVGQNCIHCLSHLQWTKSGKICMEIWRFRVRRQYRPLRLDREQHQEQPPGVLSCKAINEVATSDQQTTSTYQLTPQTGSGRYR
jgi:hypothetical protein